MFLTLILGLTACGAKHRPETEEQAETVAAQEETIHLSVLYPCEDINWVATIEEAGEEFMREYPHIILDMEPSDTGIYTENLKIKEAVDDFPDLFEIKDPSMFAEAGKLGEIPDGISALVENPVTIQGKVYAVPLFTSTYGIVYNQVYFKKYNLPVPKSYSEFLNVCNSLKRHGITPLAVGGSRKDNLNYLFNYFFQTEVLAENPDWQQQRTRGEVFFQDEDCIRMLQKYKEFMNSGYLLEDSINMNNNQLITEFVEGNTAMIYTGPWMFTQISDAYPQAMESDKNPLGEELNEEEDQAKCRIAWFFMPDADGNPVAIRESEAEWAISRECAQDEKKLEAATLFFEYFYQTVHYRKTLQSMYAIPTTKEAVLYPAAAIQQKLLVDYRYADKSDSYLGNNETPEGFQTKLYKILYSLAADTMSAEQAAQRLDEVWDKLCREQGIG